jgi:predicted transcriptional regulator
MSDESNKNAELVDLTTTIVAAFVSHNSVSSADLPQLLAQTHAALSALRQPAEIAPVEKPAPAVSIRKSVTPDYIISLEDGRKFKTLKRHLAGLGMTPDEYRQKWGLPKDYPMVAANYSAKRSSVAKSLGLGRTAKTSSASVGPKKGRVSRKTHLVTK